MCVVRGLTAAYGGTPRSVVSRGRGLYVASASLILQLVGGLTLLGVLALAGGSFVLARYRERHAPVTEQAQRFAVLLEQAPEAALTTTRDGRVLSANVAATRLLGYTSAELVGKTLSELQLQTGAEVTWSSKDGREISVSATQSPLTDASGEVGACLIVARDISVGKLITERLAASDGKIRDLTESLPLMVWTSERDGLWNYLSPQWVSYTGVPEAEQLGLGWFAQLHADDIEQTKRDWTAAAACAELFDTEFRIRRHDGVYRWFKVRAVPMKDDAGAIIKWYGTCVDIQDVKDAELAASESKRALELRVSNNDKELRAAYERMATLTIQLQTAQRVASIGSWDFELATGEVVWSDELYRTFGLEPSTRPPSFRDQTRLFDPESWARLSAAVQTAAETGAGYELVLTAIRTDGEHRNTVARAEAVRGPTGKVERLVGTFQDITSRERIVAERKTLAKRFQLATSAARIGVWEWDIQRGTLSWDASMRRIHGFDDSPNVEVAYSTWISTVHPEDRAEFESLLRDVLGGVRDFRAVYRIVRSDGQIKHVQADAVLSRDARGRPNSMTGVSWDVTEQRVAELALRSAEAMQRAILASAGSAIISVDVDGVIRSFNRAAEELLGYNVDEVVGKATPELFHDPAELETRRAALEGETGARVERIRDMFFRPAEVRAESREWTFVRKDGARVPVLLTMSAIRDSSQEIVGYLGVATDLTQSKQYEAELLSLNRLLEERTVQAESASYAKGMFLANMSHEIRTPIGAITGVAYLLGRTTLTGEQRDMVSTIERSAGVLLGMVNDVLDLSKIEAQQLTLERERFSLPNVLDDLASLMHAYANGKNIELILDIQDKLPTHFFGDRVRLMQVFTNLAANAIKFTDQGNVRVLMKAVEQNEQQTRLRFEVHDTGPGIEEEVQAKLFKPFTQAEQRGARRFGGTGLGLAIVKQLVTLMDGEVGLSSQLGHGSSFWCEIPLQRAPESMLPRAPGSELRVLIVEDHNEQRTALMSCAAQLGFRPTAAASGEQGLSWLTAAAREGRPFDLVLLDWQMPGLDGLRVVEKLRESPFLRDCQPGVILTSAYDLVALQSAPQAKLADAVLAKPLGPSTMLDTALRVVTVRKPERISMPDGALRSAGEKRLIGARILVADDSDINRDIARRILELEGASVELVCDGTEAVAKVVSGGRPFDVVLMDVQMPNEDGIDATARIRQHAGFASLPILALTAGALASERERALAAGMTDFITKPYAPEELITRVRGYVRERVPLRAAPVKRSVLPAAPVVSGAAPVAAPAPAPARAPANANAAGSGGTPKTGWAAAEGFSMDQARVLLAGDLSLFRTLVARLGEELDKSPLAAQPRDRTACLAWLHRLSGSAGVLAATGLHQATRAAEVALRENRDAEFERALLQLDEEIARTRRGIADMARRPDPDARAARVAAAKPAAVAEGAPRPDGVKRLLQCLHERDLKAFSLFLECEPQLSNSLSLEERNRLRAAIQRLDFAQACEILRPVEAALVPPRAAQG